MLRFKTKVSLMSGHEIDEPTGLTMAELLGYRKRPAHGQNDGKPKRKFTGAETWQGFTIFASA
jgi:hypothetical protein